MKNYARILTRLVNVPLAIDQSKLEVLTSQVSLNLLTHSALDTTTNVSVEHPTTNVIDNKLGLVKVYDSLVAKNGIGNSGVTSYESIKNDIQDLISEGKTKIGFDISSPGGEVNGLFALTDFIASLPSKYGIETFAFGEGMMTSAAYAIASATQKIYSTELTKSGSIAVIASLIDLTKYDEKQGVTYTILRSKDEKALINPHEKLSDKAKTGLMVDLEIMDTKFNESVAKYRPNLSIESIIDMKGKSYLGNEALSLGLVDSIVSTIDDVIKLETDNLMLNTARGNVMTLEELQSELATVKGENATLKGSLAEAKKVGASEEKVRCLGILEAGSTLKASNDMIIKMISKDRTIEDARDLFTDRLELIGEKTTINTNALNSTVAKPVSSNDDNPFAFLQEMDKNLTA